MNSSTTLNAFMNTRGYGKMQLSRQELAYIFRTFRPRSNAAPTQVWVGHFTAYGIAFCVTGNRLERVGEAA